MDSGLSNAPSIADRRWVEDKLDELLIVKNSKRLLEAKIPPEFRLAASRIPTTKILVVQILIPPPKFNPQMN